MTTSLWLRMLDVNSDDDVIRSYLEPLFGMYWLTHDEMVRDNQPEAEVRIQGRDNQLVHRVTMRDPAEVHAHV